mmetsp:Transcript_44067/g.89985  ORF Transcript_44067/g.89985 Transcript_44067/m.89985 type:complete len:265 (+) Transcript_44067:77-871(+)
MKNIAQTDITLMKEKEKKSRFKMFVMLASASVRRWLISGMHDMSRMNRSALKDESKPRRSDVTPRLCANIHIAVRRMTKKSNLSCPLEKNSGRLFDPIILSVSSTMKMNWVPTSNDLSIWSSDSSRLACCRARATTLTSTTPIATTSKSGCVTIARMKSRKLSWATPETNTGCDGRSGRGVRFSSEDSVMCDSLDESESLRLRNELAGAESGKILFWFWSTFSASDTFLRTLWKVVVTTATQRLKSSRRQKKVRRRKKTTPKKR